MVIAHCILMALAEADTMVVLPILHFHLMLHGIILYTALAIRYKHQQYKTFANIGFKCGIGKLN